MEIFNSFIKKLWPLLILGISLAGMTQTLSAGEKTQEARKSPDFQEADKNGDRHVTKQELKDYPDLLKYFDKVDIGEDGRLEKREYENLIMENERNKKDPPI
jgi:Ca2+-binding EF-hand superfamily protein